MLADFFKMIMAIKDEANDPTVYTFGDKQHIQHIINPKTHEAIELPVSQTSLQRSVYSYDCFVEMCNNPPVLAADIDHSVIHVSSGYVAYFPNTLERSAFRWDYLTSNEFNEAVEMCNNSRSITYNSKQLELLLRQGMIGFKDEITKNAIVDFIAKTEFTNSTVKTKNTSAQQESYGVESISDISKGELAVSIIPVVFKFDLPYSYNTQIGPCGEMEFMLFPDVSAGEWVFYPTSESIRKFEQAQQLMIVNQLKLDCPKVQVIN